MKPHIAIGVAVTVALVVAMIVIAPERSVFSSGPLATHHRKLECGQCHDAFTSFTSNAPCLECHDEQVLTPPERFAGEDSLCVSCHREHRGGDKLQPVASERCHGCHEPATVHARAPVMRAQKLDSPPRDCRRCHGNHAEHRQYAMPSVAEVRKHLEAAHRRGDPLFHKNTCELCHMDMRTASDANAASIPGVFDPHVTHVGRFDMRCTWCHRDVDIVQHSGTRLRRTVDTERCVECHQGEYYVAQGVGR